VIDKKKQNAHPDLLVMKCSGVRERCGPCVNHATYALFFVSFESENHQITPLLATPRISECMLQRPFAAGTILFVTFLVSYRGVR